MPHTRKKAVSVPGWKPAQFVSVTLTDEDKLAVKSAPNTFETLDESLVAMLHDGYSFKLKSDVFNGCFACYVSPPDSSANSGWMLTGRGSTPLKAVKQALYIHRVVLDGDWPDVNEPRRGELDD